MAVQGQSQAEQTRRWELLITAVREDLEGRMQHLSPDVEALERLLIEAKDLESRRDTLRAEAQALRARLREITRQGKSVRGRIGAKLHGELGFTSELLAKYGFKPRRPGGGRRPAAPKPAADPE